MAINGTTVLQHSFNTNASATQPGAGKGWWTYPQINNWGAPKDPQGYYPKPDVNILLPANYPIVNILPGVVSGINDSRGTGLPSYGSCITIKLDTPINALATHIAWNHLQAISPDMYVGRRVLPGQVVAYGGGNQSAGSAPAAVGFILYPGDNYATDAAFSKYFRYGHAPDQRLNPTPILTALNQGTLGVDLLAGTFPTSDLTLEQSGSGGGADLGKIVKNAIPIKPSENVTQALESLDYAMLIINPIPTNVDQINTPVGSFPNPFTWIGDFLNNIFFVDLPAIVYRGLIIGIGIYICFRAIQGAVDVKGAAKGVVANTAKAVQAGSEILA